MSYLKERSIKLSQPPYTDIYFAFWHSSTTLLQPSQRDTLLKVLYDMQFPQIVIDNKLARHLFIFV